MRWSALLVLGLAAVAVAAVVDALRSGPATPPQAGQPRTEETTTVERVPTPAEVLSAAGVKGTLYFTLQVEHGCVLQTLALPRLDGRGSFMIDSCEFDVSPQGNIVTGPSCPGDGIQVGPPGTTRRTAQRFSGCAPAWRPDGELTFIRDGDVVTAGGEVLVEDVARTGRSWFSRREPVRVRAVAWLTDSRMAAVLTGRARFGGDLLLVAERGRAFPVSDVSTGSTIYVDRRFRQFWIAQPGSDLSAPGISVHDQDGDFVPSMIFRSNVNGFAAASERWFALARPDNLCIYERRDPPPREEFPLTCLPFDVVDLAWI